MHEVPISPAPHTPPSPQYRPWDQIGLVLFMAGWFMFSLGFLWPVEVVFAISGLGVFPLLLGSPIFLFGLVRRRILAKRGVQPPKNKALTWASSLLFCIAILLPTVTLVWASIARERSKAAHRPENWTTLTAIDGRSEIRVPGDWKVAAELVPELGQVAASDPSQQTIVIGLFRDKRDTVATTLQEFSQQVLESLPGNSADRKIVESSMDSDTNPRRLEIIDETTVDGYRWTFLRTFIDSSTHFGYVFGWTNKSRFDEQRLMLREITGTYRLVTPSSSK